MRERHRRERMHQEIARGLARRLSRAPRLRAALGAVCILGATSCTVHVTDSNKDAGGGGNGSGGSATVSLSPSSVFLATGQSRNIAVTLARQGYDKPLTLKAYGACGASLSSCQPLPAGITASFSPATLSGSVLTSTLTLTVAPSLAAGPVPLLVDANNGDFDAPTPLNLTVTLPSLSVARAGTGTGTVTSSPAGLNCGGTCTGSFALGTNVTLTATAPAGNAFAGWSGGCTGAGATCSLTIAAPATNVTATFNSTVPAFSLAVRPATDTVAQGGSRTAAVHVTRVNGFAGPVNLSVSGAPAGLTVTATPASATGDSATLAIAAPLSLATGNYPLTLTGTGAGVTQQTATFNVLVTPAAGGSANVAFSFASCDPGNVPIWVGVQNGSGAWTRVAAGSNSTFSFPVSASTGVAYVQQSGTSYSTTVIYASGPELASIASGDPCRMDAQTGAKRLNGTVSRLGVPPVFATISVGGADTTYLATSGPDFTLAGVPAGTRDLVAAVHGATGANGLTPLLRLLVRRNVNYGNNASIPLLDMSGPESFVPEQHLIQTANLGGEQLSASESLITANGISASIHGESYALAGQPSVFRYFGIPDSLLQPADLHRVEADAVSSAGGAGAARFVITLIHSAIQPTVTFGPALATPTVSSIAASPYLRPRARLQAQSEYNTAAFAHFDQNGNSVDVVATAAYFGGVPATWSLDVPDLSGAAYDAAWGLHSGGPVAWGVYAFAGNPLILAGATPFAGAQITGAARQSQGSVTIAGRAPSMLWLRRH